MNYNFHRSLDEKCHRFLNAVEPGIFVFAMGGTFDSDMPGTFESDTGGTFNPLLSNKVYKKY